MVGAVNPLYLKAIRNKYLGNLPIETLFEQIDSSVKYAAAGESPYTPE